MASRQAKQGATAGVYVIVVIAVLGIANWLAKDYNKTVDVTANKRFTLSDQTKKVVGGLTKEVNVYYFEKADHYEPARDMFDRYRNLSSKFVVNYVDPDKKPDVARMEGMRTFGDIIIDSGVKKETAKALTEEELTGALIRSMKTGTRTVCFVEGSGEHRISATERDGYSAFKDALEKNNYKTQVISLLEKPDVPKECTIVLVGGPKRDYLQPVVDSIRTYVAGGGNAVVNFDPVLDLPDQKMGDTPNLSALVAEWGVTTHGDIIVDQGAASRMFGAVAPAVATYESHPITRVMQDNLSVMYMARSLEVKAPAEKLFSTSEGSSSLTNPKVPIKQEDVEKGTKGPFVIGAATKVGTGKTAGRVVVVGSSNWLANNMLGAPIANRDLALNVMNWLTSDEELISIRPKEPEDRRLTVTGRALNTMGFVSIIGIPLFVILSGVSVWWKRR